MTVNPITFDTNGLYILLSDLYILLSDLGSDIQFHWAFYLVRSPGHGVMFHMINNIETGNTWKYQSKSITGIPNTLNVLVAMKIAVIDPTLHAALAERLASVSDTAPVTCCLWLKRALQDLDDEGYIQLAGKVDDIEEDGLTEAAENQTTKKKNWSYAPLRDRIRAQSGAMCLERKARGLMKQFPFIMIGGISNYADTYKSASWKGFAAATAAATARVLLEEVQLGIDDQESAVATASSADEIPLSNPDVRYSIGI
ncbi:hypothetical protein BBP40_006186 [Aspergillus hancockii]|nr:hypothetical protein BBP40_006186 [Aspergillus hancockii]